MLALLCLAMLQVNGEVPGPTYSSYVDGMRWDFVVRPQALESAPRWPQDSPAPPLAPREAIASARRMLETLLPDSENWRLGNVTLQPLHQDGVWLYTIEFLRDMRPTGLGSYIGSPMRIVVLMDGTAVTPTTRPWRPAADALEQQMASPAGVEDGRCGSAEPATFIYGVAA